MLSQSITLIIALAAFLPPALAIPATVKVLEKPGLNLAERDLLPRISCPAGQYLKDKAKTCTPCATDFGEGTTACSTAGASACASPFFLLRAQNGIYMDTGGVPRCVAECPAGGFPQGRNCVNCERVDINAATCTATAPLTCKPRTVLKNGKCTGSCGDGFYLPRGSRECAACNLRDKRALTCDADFIFTCTDGYVGLGNQCGCAIQKFINPDTNLCVDPDAVLARVAGFTATINGVPDAQTSGPKVATSHGCYDFCAANTGQFLFTIQLDQPDTCICGRNLLIQPPPQPLVGSQTYSATVDCNYILSHGGWQIPGAICEDVALVGPYCFVKNLGANTVASTQKVCRLYVK